MTSMFFFNEFAFIRKMLSTSKKFKMTSHFRSFFSSLNFESTRTMTPTLKETRLFDLMMNEYQIDESFLYSLELNSNCQIGKQMTQLCKHRMQSHLSVD